MVEDNLNKVRMNIEAAAGRSGRSGNEVRLICVTKEAESADVLRVVQAGVNDLGENRVKEAALRYRAIGDGVRWHMIGHLQTNKVREAVRMFSLIHSVDSLRLALRIDSSAREIGKIQDILIEVNVSGELSKFGVAPGELTGLTGEVKKMANINLCGLMTVTPFSSDPEESRGYFKKMRDLTGEYALKELSMGMTQDYAVAVEEGATMVRVGRAIFNVDSRK